jgi:hypothetical protein
MKGLGMFSGTIYSDEDRLNAPECCHVISDEQASDKSWTANKHAEDIQDCIRCMGCPKSQGRA